MIRPRHLLAVVAALVVAASLAGCSGAVDRATTATTSPASSPASLLFSLHGPTTVGDGTLDVSLGDGQVTFVTDRPDRQAGRFGSAAFAALWPDDGFAADPPNAIVTTSTATATVELRTARWDAASGTLSFGFVPIGSSTLPRGEIGRADLFVDDLPATCVVSSPPAYQPQLSTFMYFPVPIVTDPREPAPTRPTCDEALAAFGPLFGAWGPTVEPFTSVNSTLGTSWSCSGGPTAYDVADGGPLPLPGLWNCTDADGDLVSMLGTIPATPLPVPPRDVIAADQYVIGPGGLGY
jgi:hypothetical protein